MSRPGPSSRLFFALLPTQTERRAIEQHAAQLSPDAGRKVPPDNWHITLHFLGNVPHDKIDILCLDATAIVLPTFDFTIDDCGWWEKTGIFWLGPTHSPPALLDLSAQLGSLAARRKLTMEKRRFHPHLTLMRGVHTPPQGVLVKPFTWQAREFWLMQSEPTAGGVKYRKLESWPLRA